MTRLKPSIIFMGTPEFAIPSLKILLDNNFLVKAVVTSVDKPAGRGCKLMFSDVKKFALENNLPLLQPEKLKDNEFISTLKEIDADLFIVVAFRMLPKEVWQLPRLGTFNLHSSLLPNYRGAAPINHVIINGETKTGVTTFFINEDIDTGNIIMQQECEILTDEDAGSLHDRLKNIGANLVLKTVQAISDGDINTIKQESLVLDNLKYASKLTKEFCKIDWTKDSKEVYNFIRGLSPYPAAYSKILKNDLEILKIFKVSLSIENHNHKIGELITDNKNYIKVACSDGFINIEELQISGKKRMNSKDFLNGYKFTEDFYLV